MSSEIDRLSVVIVTWNGDDLLKNCLDSIFAVYGAALEIVVVDNANATSTRDLVARFREKVENVEKVEKVEKKTSNLSNLSNVSNVSNLSYVPAPDNLGFAGGNNLGLKSCTRDFVLLLNNDTIIHEDSFSPLLEFLRDHPKAGIVQGTMNIPALNDGLDDCGTMMTPFGIQRHLHRGEPTATAQLRPRRVTAAKGAMMMFRRAVVESTGFLFYDHFKSYFEETDFCRRAASCGWQTWFVPTPPIDHLCGRTSAKFKTDEIWEQYFRNTLYSFAHNWGMWGRLVMFPTFAMAALALIMLRRLRELRGLSKVELVEVLSQHPQHSQQS